jgi:hypothetical protein
MDPDLSEYFMPLCTDCERRAVNREGSLPRLDSPNETGDNPVWVDGYQCYRRYHLGGFRTIFDPDQSCRSYVEFYSRHSFGYANTRFTLQPWRWYAMQMHYLSDQPLDLFLSPIKVFSIRPEKGGHRRLRIEFFHADYPEGVQSKRYDIRTLDRGANHLVAMMPGRLLLFGNLTLAWLRRWYPQQRWEDGRNPERQVELLHPGV